jgi:nicotinate-nucleotide pyrophosphorylase (carboxylating)
MGLFERVMLKDNHLAAGSATRGDRLAALVRTARARYPGVVVEVEIDALEQIDSALEAEADVLLFDNFSPGDLKLAVARVGDRACTEASGGIAREDLPTLGAIGLDFISIGGLIHQSQWVDIGFDWDVDS